jgi:hypothetical protein
MLTLIHEERDKSAAQEKLELALKNSLNPVGIKNIGIPGDNFDIEVYAVGPGKLWVAFGKAGEGAASLRFWNAFGIYRDDRPAQTITVEINIPIGSNAGRVAGFFARDNGSGDIFLMHSGRVGGGRAGIGKSAFLVWSKAKLIEVFDGQGGIRSGIAVGRLDDPDLAGQIWAFVKSVQRFKDKAASGELNTPDFKHYVDEFDRYSEEFSGKKSGARGGECEYVTYHGRIVQALYDERMARATPGERVCNSSFIDLYVKKDAMLCEVYEVKTGIGRQMLYTAIGQLVTHAVAENGEVAKYLVVPADESIAHDLKKAIAALGIHLRHFRLIEGDGEKVVQLI